MKKLTKDSLLKSILISTTITLAISSIIILCYTFFGIHENQKWLNMVNNCIKDKKYCEKDWPNDITEDANNYEDHWLKDFDILEERYSNKYQVVANWVRKDYTESSIIWMKTCRDFLLFNTLLGIIIGIIIHFIFIKKKTKKKKN